MWLGILSGLGALRGLRHLIVLRMVRQEKQKMEWMGGGRLLVGGGGGAGERGEKNEAASSAAFSALESTDTIVSLQGAHREGMWTQE